MNHKVSTHLRHSNSIYIYVTKNKAFFLVKTNHAHRKLQTLTTSNYDWTTVHRLKLETAMGHTQWSLPVVKSRWIMLHEKASKFQHVQLYTIQCPSPSLHTLYTHFITILLDGKNITSGIKTNDCQYIISQSWVDLSDVHLGIRSDNI